MWLCALTHAVPVVVTLVKSEGIFIELVKYSDCCVPSLPRVYNMSGDRDSMTIRFVFHKGTPDTDAFYFCLVQDVSKMLALDCGVVAVVSR